MARPNLLRRKLAGGRTCLGPIFQEFWSPELLTMSFGALVRGACEAYFAAFRG